MFIFVGLSSLLIRLVCYLSVIDFYSHNLYFPFLCFHLRLFSSTYLFLSSKHLLSFPFLHIFVLFIGYIPLRIFRPFSSSCSIFLINIFHSFMTNLSPRYCFFLPPLPFLSLFFHFFPFLSFFSRCLPPLASFLSSHSILCPILLSSICSYLPFPSFISSLILLLHSLSFFLFLSITHYPLSLSHLLLSFPLPPPSIPLFPLPSLFSPLLLPSANRRSGGLHHPAIPIRVMTQRKI